MNMFVWFFFSKEEIKKQSQSVTVPPPQKKLVPLERTDAAPLNAASMGGGVSRLGMSDGRGFIFILVFGWGGGQGA